MKTVSNLAGDESMKVEIDSRELDFRWYAAYTRSRHEKRVLDRLQAMSIECFLPLCNTLSRWKDRNMFVQLPLFPGYLFDVLFIIYAFLSFFMLYPFIFFCLYLTLYASLNIGICFFNCRSFLGIYLFVLDFSRIGCECCNHRAL